VKITVITSTYNSITTLQDTIDSIQRQSYCDIETILIDGGSTDGTLEIIKENKGVTKFISEPDKGIYDALNKGVQLATGDVVGFVHSDDLLASNKIISQIATAFQTHKVDGVYGDLQYVNKNNTNKVIRVWKSCDFKFSMLKNGWMPAHPTLFLKKEVYEKHGNFDLSYKIAADYDFILRIFKDKTLKFSYLPEVITTMRVGGVSNRSIKNIIQKTKEDYKAITSNNVGNMYSIIKKNTSKIKQFILK
jgi:glycosyltransferase involved in cell wall biosynthesis